MIGPLSRILVRYAAGALVAFGLVGERMGDQIATDADLILIVGLGLGAATEGLYAVAKARGWNT